jgi:hypothetical protein
MVSRILAQVVETCAYCMTVRVVTVCVFVMLDLYFDSVKCMLVSVKLLCVCVKFLKILSKKGIFVIMEKLGLFLSNVI